MIGLPRIREEPELDHKNLRELIELISKSNFETFELEREGFRLKLVKGANTAMAPPVRPEAPGAVVRPEPAPPAPAAEPVDPSLIEVVSPIVGTYYEAPRPDAAPFVTVGGRVQKGQVLCVVEAMKLMNEIESEVDAEVVEILAANGQPVEYDELLFRLRPV